MVILLYFEKGFLMSSTEYPLKNVRLKQLHDAGFNIADFACWAPGQLNPEELRTFLNKHGRISCRHFHQDEKTYFKCPVLYDQTNFDTVLAFCSEHNQKFYTLCNEAIKLDDSICAGNILVLNLDTYFVEYFHGSGTPRDVEKKAPPELKTYSKSGYTPAEGDRPPSEVLELVLKARRFQALANKAYIVEFSVYPYPIGRNQTTTICWEWRWGWLHYQLQANQYLLDELKKANQEIEQLKVQLKEIEVETEVRTIVNFAKELARD